MSSTTLIELIKTHEDAITPTKATPGSAGLDLHCVKDFILHNGERLLVDTGFNISLEFGYEGQVRSKSGLALKHGIAVLNSPGTIDSDYRGALGVILINHSTEDYEFKKGDKIAQLVVKPVCAFVRTKIVSEFSRPETVRGAGGYGSTGR